MELINNNKNLHKLIINYKEIQDDFKCQKCKKLILNKEMLQCNKGDCCFCKQCWIDILFNLNNKEYQSYLNENCKSTIYSINQLSRNKIYENLLIKYLKFKCPYSISNEDTNKEQQEQGYGCNEIIKFEELETHLNQCIYKYIVCDNYGCNEKIPINSIDTHKDKYCKYSKIECQYCLIPIQRNSIQQHFNNDCEYILIECTQLCGKRILRKELTEHINDNCDQTIIECKYKDGGCNQKFKRIDQFNHYNFINHSTYISILFDKQLNEILLLKEIIKLQQFQQQKQLSSFNDIWEIPNFFTILENNINNSINNNNNNNNNIITIKSPILNLGPFKIGIVLCINKIKNEITIIYEEKCYFFKECELFFELFNLYNQQHPKKGIFINNTAILSINEILEYKNLISYNNKNIRFRFSLNINL